MSLNVLVEVLTKEKANGLPYRITIASTLNYEGESAEFLWGIVYTRNVKTKIELVYEGVSGELYLIRPSSLEEVQKNSRIFTGEERRYRLFGSVDFFKDFFDTLNRDKIEGKIDDVDYLNVFEALNVIYNDIYSTSLNSFMIWKILGAEMISKYVQKNQKKFKHVESLIRGYLQRAKSHLMVGHQLIL